nr:hypothetical protein [Tanacetum cinerariifolium]
MGLTKDGKLRHLADGLAWKAFDARYPKFASDPHSVRLGLASDGFNPFRTMSTSYSTWPVVLIPYNLPPWICMKRKSLILSSIIPGAFVIIFERFLMRLKSYVHNKAQPEGLIAEGYIKEECLTFCARYFKGVETFINRPRRNDGIIPTKEMYMFNSGGRKLGKVEIVELDGTLFAQAHRYVLLSHPKIQTLQLSVAS